MELTVVQGMDVGSQDGDSTGVTMDIVQLDIR